MYGHASKNDVDVKFPIKDLDLTEFLDARTTEGRRYVYDLFAVSNHTGSLSGGHYYAYAKSIGKDEWNEFNDGHVSKIHNPHNMQTRGAFALFYELKK